jgi:hypothetical protein
VDSEFVSQNASLKQYRAAKGKWQLIPGNSASISLFPAAVSMKMNSK